MNEKQEVIKRIKPYGEKLGLNPDEIESSFKKALNSDGDLGLDRVYLREVGYHVYELNHTPDPAEKEKILQKLQFLNTLYLAVKGEEIENLALLTRHLECDSWEQKKWGFTPNAQISEDARNAMKTGEPNAHTHAFLYDEEFGTSSYKDTSLRVEVSPVDRAQESATHILPKEMKNRARISIQDYLGEISHAVSGFAVKSNEELDEVLEDEEVKGDKSLKQRAIMNLQFPVSKVVYGEKYFEEQKEKREGVLKELREYGDSGEISPEEETRKVAYKTEKDKIKTTMEHIHNTEEKNLWLVYHQKNSRRFLEEALGMQDVYTNYGETRHVFKLKSQDPSNYDSKLFSPPYVLTIDQKTGEIGARFSPECMKLSEKIKLNENAEEINLDKNAKEVEEVELDKNAKVEPDKNAKEVEPDKEVNYGFRRIPPEVQTNNDEGDFLKALRELKVENEKEDTPPSVRQSVRNFVNIVYNLNSQGEFNNDELPTITRYIHDTTTLIQDSKKEDSKYYNSSCDNYNHNIEKAMGTKRRWGQIVGGALLCIAGVLAVAAAVTLTAMTFGAGTPLTIPAAAIGATAIAAGVGVCTGAAVVFGAGVYGAKMAHDERKKGPIAPAMEEIRSNIEEDIRSSNIEKTKKFKEIALSDRNDTTKETHIEMEDFSSRRSSFS